MENRGLVSLEIIGTSVAKQNLTTTAAAIMSVETPVREFTVNALASNADNILIGFANCTTTVFWRAIAPGDSLTYSFPLTENGEQTFMDLNKVYIQAAAGSTDDATVSYLSA